MFTAVLGEKFQMMQAAIPMNRFYVTLILYYFIFWISSYFLLFPYMSPAVLGEHLQMMQAAVPIKKPKNKHSLSCVKLTLKLSPTTTL